MQINQNKKTGEDHQDLQQLTGGIKNIGEQTSLTTQSKIIDTLAVEPDIKARIEAWEELKNSYLWTSQYNDMLNITDEGIQIKGVGNFALNDSKSTSYNEAKSTDNLDGLPKFSIFQNLRSFIEGMTSQDQMTFFRDVMNMDVSNNFYITSDIDGLGEVCGLIIERGGLYTSSTCQPSEQGLVRFVK